jgi:hypothetical protein
MRAEASPDPIISKSCSRGPVNQRTLIRWQPFRAAHDFFDIRLSYEDGRVVRKSVENAD